ncbi:MAG: hypothetical protein ACYTF0_03845 [Planctomycetota bacterium]
MLRDALWPLIGLIHFLTRPGLWRTPLLASTIALIATLGGAYGAGAWLWPGEQVDLAWWPLGELFGSLWDVLKPLLAAVVTAVVIWYASLALLCALAFDALIGRILRERGISVREEPVLKSIASALRVLLRSLPWLIGWPVLAIICGFVAPPAAAVVGLIGTCHLTLIEACDIVLAKHNLRGDERWRQIQRRRGSLLIQAIISGALFSALALTVVGSVLMAPALFTACALWLSSEREQARLLPPAAS